MRRKLRALIIRMQRSRSYRRVIGPLLLRNITFRMFSEEEEYILTVLKKDKVIGSVCLSYEPDEYPDGWMIRSLRIDRLYRHLGIGRELLARIADFVGHHGPGKLYAYVITAYPDIIAFYRAAGFAIDYELMKREQSEDFTPVSQTIPPAAPDQVFS